MNAEARTRRLRAYLALRALPGVGRAGVEAFLGPGPADRLDEDPQVLMEHFRGGLLDDAAARQRAIENAQAQAQRARDLGLEFIFRGEKAYPPGFERLADPPRLVFTAGRPSGRPAVAVVGTRAPSAWGLETARRYARALAAAGFAVLNGLAQGVDEAALEAAWEAGGPSVGVLAGGHGGGRPLERRLLECGGWLLSEDPPGALPHKGSFIARDRLQAALSAAVLVVETGPTGGTLHTVRAAEACGVPVLALLNPDLSDPGAGGPPPDDPRGLGAWELLRRGRALWVRTPAHCVAEVRSRGVP